MTSITTAEDYIREQEILEAEARELLPFKADLCTQDYDKNEIGKPLRQAIYLCKTCGLDKGVCVGCSIICHGGEFIVSRRTLSNSFRSRSP